MNKLLSIVILIALAFTPGCATKSYVDRQISDATVQIIALQYDDHIEVIEHIGDNSRAIRELERKCVIPGPNLRRMLQDRADMYERIIVLQKELDWLKSKTEPKENSHE